MKYVCMYFVYEKMRQNLGVDTFVIPPLLSLVDWA